MKVKFSIAMLLGALLITCLAPSDVGAQACGYSINTIFAENESGVTIRDLNIGFSKRDLTSAHALSPPTKIFWDDEAKAHVIVHGLCGAHKNVTVKFSAKGYESVEQTINMPLGFQGFVLTLMRKGSEREGSLTQFPCLDGNELRQCVARPFRKIQ